MLPQAVLAGVSYADFREMTVGEIRDVLRVYSEMKRHEADERLEALKIMLKTSKQNAALSAYYGGYYSRPRVKMPETLAKAFPDIFGRVHGGGIKAENWQESERALLQIAANFKKRGGRNADR